MKKSIALLISVSALACGCADYATPRHDPEPQHEPVDRNRNSVPDSLERKAVPLDPVIDRRLKSPG